MFRSIPSSILALSVAAAVATGMPLPAWANAPATTAAVEIDIALDQPDDDAVAARLRGDVVKALNAEGIAVTKSAGASEGLIKLHVRWNAEDNHEITAEVVSGGTTATPEGGPWVCDTCREAQLSAKVAEVVPLLVPLLPETPDEAADGGSTTPGEPDDPQPHGGGKRAKLGPMGKAGIPLLVVGVGGAIAGGVIAGMGVKRKSDATDAAMTEGTNYRKPGIPIAVVGGALAITGLALLAVDLSRSRKAKKKNAGVMPMLAPGLAGLGVRGRF